MTCLCAKQPSTTPCRYSWDNKSWIFTPPTTELNLVLDQRKPFTYLRIYRYPSDIIRFLYADLLTPLLIWQILLFLIPLLTQGWDVTRTGVVWYKPFEDMNDMPCRRYSKCDVNIYQSSSCQLPLRNKNQKQTKENPLEVYRDQYQLIYSHQSQQSLLLSTLLHFRTGLLRLERLLATHFLYNMEVRLLLSQRPITGFHVVLLAQGRWYISRRFIGTLDKCE